MATLRYLSVLESLPWHFIWDNIEYHVTDYPQAEITIRIYTLSFEEKWLDV
jgi:MSHA biogenesis protein MshJ